MKMKETKMRSTNNFENKQPGNILILLLSIVLGFLLVITATIILVAMTGNAYLMFLFPAMSLVMLYIGLHAKIKKNNENKIKLNYKDFFKIKAYKKQIESLKSEIATITLKGTELANDIQELKEILTPEHERILGLKKEIQVLEESKILINSCITNLNETLADLTEQERLKRDNLIMLDEEATFQEISLYSPNYDFVNSEQFKNRLDAVRKEQKELIKSSVAASGNKYWTVDGCQKKGKKIVSDMVKLVIRSFNNECDACVSAVKFNNVEPCIKRINSAFEALNKLGAMMSVKISDTYKELKIQELHLAYEYQLKKQEEKEQLKLLREQQREEAKAQKELEEAKKDLQKEISHYKNALNKVPEQLNNAKSDEEAALYKIKAIDLETKVEEIGKSLDEIDYREANKRAGYVYIISNIGSFGENIFKIGMTRRLNPIDRIDELSDASVPFNFDIHTIIFTEDAPKLESALHNAFDSKKVNMINSRREFFNVTIEEIENVIKNNFDKTVDFIKIPDAEQYRQTLLIRKNLEAEECAKIES